MDGGLEPDDHLDQDRIGRNVKLEYSKDNFATATVIAASTPNTGSYTWTVANDISATVKVRVADAADSTVNDVSDANFKILAAFTVSSPNGGETWAVGNTQAITWTTSGTVPNVKLEFSKDNFATATVITASTPNTGTTNWLIPDAISATVKVRVSDPADARPMTSRTRTSRSAAGSSSSRRTAGRPGPSAAPRRSPGRPRAPSPT